MFKRRMRRRQQAAAIVFVIGVAGVATGCSRSGLDRGAASEEEFVQQSEACTAVVAGCRVAGSEQPFSTNLRAEPLDTIECRWSLNSDAELVPRYEWQLVTRPEDSTTVLVPDGTEVSPNFFADLAGSYVMRLRNTTGNTDQFCNPDDIRIRAIPDGDVHVQLVWDTPSDNDQTDGNGTDVDLHFRHPNGGWEHSRWDCHFRNRNPDWGRRGQSDDDPSLDIDDTDGAGPENINLTEPEDGTTYLIGAHYWSAHGFDGPSLATVRVYVLGELVFEALERPIDEGEFWVVGSLTWPNVEVDLIDEVLPQIP